MEIIFIKGNGLVSKAIQLVTRGKWSHVAIFLDESTLFETEWSTKCRLIDINDTDYLEKEHEIISVPINENQKNLLQIITYMSLGKKYDFKLIVKLFFKALLGYKIKSNSSETLVCSELVGYVLLSLGIFTYKEASIANTSPQELYEILKSKMEVE